MYLRALHHDIALVILMSGCFKFNKLTYCIIISYRL